MKKAAKLQTAGANVGVPESASSVKVKKTKKEKDRSLQAQKARSGWLFISPFLIGFFVLYLPMIVNSINFTFNKRVPLLGSGTINQFVGWDNYKYALFEDTGFVDLIISGATNLLLNTPAVVIFSLFMAVLLNQKMKGRAVFRAIFFIPVIVSTGIIEHVDKINSLADKFDSMHGGDTGGMEVTNTGAEFLSSVDITRMLGSVKLGSGLIEYVTNLVNNVFSIVNRSGVQMLIFLAGLQSISPAIYESCHIDGASAWETFWKITFPMISPMILVNVVYTVIDSFTSQNNAVMTHISTVYKTVKDGDVRSTAMAWIYFTVIFLMLALVSALLSAFVFYQKRDTK